MENFKCSAAQVKKIKNQNPWSWGFFMTKIFVKKDTLINIYKLEQYI